ncbi:hypothetical protein B0H14DRAFT_3653544 [Mycena olivaceomarginata]|nr:hypothetical protein B0H14DRAFT_3653544 [Mycena olivaceomarginata]
MTSDMVEQALLNAEKAMELYRELVALAPCHLPTLASSLRNLGSILWDVGCQDAGVAACKAAVGIMWMVVKPETYFLPVLGEALEQLVVYLAEKGDVRGVSAAGAECAQVRREFAALPAEPEFLFETVADMVDLEDKAEGWAEADESHDTSEGLSVGAVESDNEADKYHDTSEPLMSVEPPALISEPSGHSSTSAPGPSTGTDAPVQANPTGDSTTVILNSSSTPAIQNPAAMDTVNSMFSKPLEVDMRLYLQSRLMDILWWVLLGILFAIAWRRVV